MLILKRNTYRIGISIALLVLMLVTSATIIAIADSSKNKSLYKIKDNNSSSSQPIALSKQYDNRDSHYRINYPADWIYDDSGKGAVVFSGKKNTLAYYSTVNIETVLSKKSGGEYSNVDDLIVDVKRQALQESPKTTFVGSGPFTSNLPSGVKLNGKYVTFIYSYKGQIIEQWQIVVPRIDGQVFYTWAYTAPLEQYGHDLQIAKAMLSTWLIY